MALFIGLKVACQLISAPYLNEQSVPFLSCPRWIHTRSDGGAELQCSGDPTHLVIPVSSLTVHFANVIPRAEINIFGRHKQVKTANRTVLGVIIPGRDVLIP